MKVVSYTQGMIDAHRREELLALHRECLQQRSELEQMMGSFLDIVFELKGWEFTQEEEAARSRYHALSERCGDVLFHSLRQSPEQTVEHMRSKAARVRDIAPSWIEKSEQGMHRAVIQGYRGEDEIQPQVDESAAIWEEKIQKADKKLAAAEAALVHYAADQAAFFDHIEEELNGLLADIKSHRAHMEELMIIRRAANEREMGAMQAREACDPQPLQDLRVTLRAAHDVIIEGNGHLIGLENLVEEMDKELTDEEEVLIEEHSGHHHALDRKPIFALVGEYADDWLSRAREQIKADPEIETERAIDTAVRHGWQMDEAREDVVTRLQGEYQAVHDQAQVMLRVHKLMEEDIEFFCLGAQLKLMIS